MRDRFITWGTRAGARHLVSFELDAEDAQIIRRVVPAGDSTDTFMRTVLSAWEQRNVINFPAGTERDVITMSTSGTIVPEGIEIEDKLRIADAERNWPMLVVRARLKRQFAGEFEEIRDVINGLEKFEEAVFERLKGAWNKVQHELNEKVLRYEDTRKLKKASDELFAKMKLLRRGKEKEVRNQSREVRAELQARLAEAQTRLEEKRDLRGLFGHLKGIQTEVGKAKLAPPDRHALRKRLDELFKAVKSEIDATGADAGHLTQQRERLEKRLAGLEGAIKRMRYSVDRDQKDKYYENKRQQRANSQLAEQLAAAKLLMLEDRSGSKQEKLDDMLATEANLKQQLEKLRKREAKAVERRQQARGAKAGATPVASSTGKPRITRERRRGGLVPQGMILTAAAALDLAPVGADE